MKHLKFNDSPVMREFGRIMQERGSIQKIAQALPPPAVPLGTTVPNVAPLPAGEMPPTWHKVFANLEAARGNVKALESMQNYLQTLNYPEAEQGYYDEALQKLQRYMAPESIAADFHAKQQSQHAQAPQKNPLTAKHQSLSQREKTADQKCYDVTPDSDMVGTAHPKSAVVSGDVVENIAEQQEADLEVAQKSAKEILTALYKLAKQLQAQNNIEAYKLVKATFLDIAKTIKKA